MNTCPNCGKPAADDARFCANCGAMVKSSENTDSTLSKEQSTEVRFTCPHCGTELMGDSREAGATYPCLKCGKEVHVPDASVKTPSNPPALPPSSVNWRRGRCKHCGNVVQVGTTPCPHCGHDLKWPKTNTIATPSGGASNSSIAESIRKEQSNGSIILGVLSLLFCWIPIVGVILAVIGLISSGAKKNMTGGIICVMGLVLSIIFAIHGFEAGREYEARQRADQFIREWNESFR